MVVARFTGGTKFGAILALGLLVSCDYGVLWEDPPYLVQWIDTSGNNLVYDLGQGNSIGRISGHIIAVGSNAKYVVAEQRNQSTHEIAYFYIEKAKDHKVLEDREITQGPFSKTRFESISKELGLPAFIKRF